MLSTAVMPRASANGIEIEYEAFGSSDWPAIVLISGLGSQMISFPEDFCRQLVDRGYYVIRHDNRDVGLSSKVEGGNYTLEDMADDTSALLEVLGVSRANVVGVSMGGMIGQMMAIRHPFRVISLTSIMSTTGAPGVGGAADEETAEMLRRPLTGETREERVAAAVERSRLLWGDTPQFPFDEEWARARAEAAIDRSDYPEGAARQLAAIKATGDRTDYLRHISAPVLVIHGTNDRAVVPSGGEATAAAIPGAELMLIEGMGHNLPREAYDQLVSAIDAIAERAAATS